MNTTDVATLLGKVFVPSHSQVRAAVRWRRFSRGGARSFLSAVGLSAVGLSFVSLSAVGTVLTLSVSPAAADELADGASSEDSMLLEGVSAEDASVEESSGERLPSPAVGAPSVDADAADFAAEAERERSRQRLLDYLQRLRSRPDVSMPAVTSPALDFPSLGSEVFDAQLAGYLAYVNSVGTPDILIVGSSRALQGIDPTELRSQLAAQGYPDLKVYNFSVNGATAQVVNFILSELLPGELPPVVVWGDGSRAFNNGRRDRTWESLMASPGYGAILRGEVPAFAASVDAAADISDIADTVITFANSSGTLASYEVELSVDEPIVITSSAFGSSSSALSVGSSVVNGPVNSPVTAGEGPVPSELPPSEVPLSELPSPESALIGARLNGLTLDGLGFSAVSDRFEPTLYYQQYPRVSGQYDGAYAPFALQGDQAIALSEVATTVARQNSQLIFVNLPLSDSYLDDFRLYYEDRFQRFLQVESELHGFEVVDLLQVWQGQPNLFADPSHINQHGAAVLASQLAFEPTLLLALQARPIP